MKELTFIILFCLSASLVNAQQIERSVISSTGSNATMHSMTVGEVAVESAKTGSVWITQGFQQPGNWAVGVDEVQKVNTNFELWPNPSVDFVNIKLSSSESIRGMLILVNMQGTEVEMQQVEIIKDEPGTYKMDMRKHASGQYMVYIQPTDGKAQEITSFVKQ